MNSEQISRAFDDVFDQAILFHGFTRYMRDYEVVFHATADPRSGIEPEFLVYRFVNCVSATVTTTVLPDVWARSLDDLLIDYATGRDLDGYVWGAAWQVNYPGMRLLPQSDVTARWQNAIGVPFFEAVIEANAHEIRLLFADVSVRLVERGYAPFTVR